MGDLTVVAESAVHPGRRLLQSGEGHGFLQLAPQATPLPLSHADFARLRAMRHYRPRPHAMAFAALEAYELSD